MGYEGCAVEEVIADLVSSGVSVVFDVRLTPLSRKPGFSKRKLAEKLAEHGIGYEHLPELGNPRANRDAYRRQGTEQGDRAREIYAAVLARPDAQAALTALAKAAASGPAATRPAYDPALDQADRREGSVEHDPSRLTSRRRPTAAIRTISTDNGGLTPGSSTRARVQLI
ncbi:MAG: DUF488 domain-containing protein [Bifidobacteriaceae bacterium]|nr:DUF488 domain-containing protein [Bifidobacteriaceae bacterium]